MDELLRRIRRLEDEAEIKRLKARYFNAGDTQDLESLRDCFTEDADIDYPPYPPFQGRDALYRAFRQAAATYRMVNVHHGHNGEIHFVDDDRAEGVWNLQYCAYLLDSKRFLYQSSIYYDVYVRTAEGWRIGASRTETRLALEGAVDDDSLVQVLSAKHVPITEPSEA